MNKIMGASLVLLGVGVGCGAATVATKTWPETAVADSGSGWFCAVADRLPDVQDAHDWHGSKKIEEGLNKMAGHVPRGEILTIPAGSKMASLTEVICVKQ